MNQRSMEGMRRRQSFRLSDWMNVLFWCMAAGLILCYIMLSRPFDLSITEVNGYRPRWLAFLVQFLDENIFFRVVRRFPWFGNRLPFYFLAMALTVISVAMFVRVCWPKLPGGFGAFAGACCLFMEDYQITTWLRARSAKLLTLPVILFVTIYFLRRYQEKWERRQWYKETCYGCFIIFPLLTLDEQVLAWCAFLLAGAVLFSVVDKTLYKPLVTFGTGLFMYVPYYLWWGKALFTHFTTGDLRMHGHTIGSAVGRIGLQSISRAWEVLLQNIPVVLLWPAVLLVALYLLCSIMLWRRSWKRNLTRIDEFYLHYLDEAGGFMKNVTDMVVTEDLILLKAVPEEEMQFENSAVNCAIWTPFTSEDFLTARQASGTLEIRENMEGEQYGEVSLRSGFYLNVQKERILVLRAEVENPKEYNALVVMVNNIAYPPIAIPNRTVEVELPLKTERYRAARITLNFIRLDESTEGTVRLNELKMK